MQELRQDIREINKKVGAMDTRLTITEAELRGLVKSLENGKLSQRYWLTTVIQVMSTAGVLTLFKVLLG